MENTNKVIADWIYDRVTNGKDEDVGSMDFDVIDGNEITICKDGDDGDVFFNVWINNDFDVSLSVDEDVIYEEVLNKVTNYTTLNA